MDFSRLLVAISFLSVTVIIKNEQHEIPLSMVYNMTTFWDFYFLTCADGSYYGFFMNLVILRVDPIEPHYGNQSTHADVILSQVSRFAHNLNNRSSYHPYYIN